MVLFNSLQPYFTDPLVWIGVILLLIFLFSRYLLSHEIITQLPNWLDGDKAAFVLKHGFVLGLLVMVLGIGLKMNQLNETEESHAISLVNTETVHNLAVIEQLLQNTRTLMDSQQVIATALRASDSEIMQTLFPKVNQPVSENINFSQIVDASFTELQESNLLKSKVAMNAFDVSKNRIKAIISPLNQALISMQSPDNKPYIKTQLWQDYQAVLVSADDFDQQGYGKSLATMQVINDQYDEVLRDSADYFNEALSFMERNTFISNGPVFEVLTKEHKALKSLNKMYDETTVKLSALKRLLIL